MDAETFAAEVRGEYPRLVRSVALFCGDRTVAEDAVQEALARAWDRTRRGQVIDSLPAWVAVVATNQTRSAARRRARWRRRMTEVRPDLVAPDATASVARDDAVRGAILGLPRRQREVVVLHYYLGLPVAEIGHQLGVTDGAVKNALHNARSHLATALGANDAEDHIDARC